MNMRKTKSSLLVILGLFFAFVACKDDFTEEDFLRLQAELEAEQDSVANAIRLDSLNAQQLRDSLEFLMEMEAIEYQRFLDSIRRADSIAFVQGFALPYTYTVQVLDGSNTATTSGGTRTDAVNAPANDVTVTLSQYGETRTVTAVDGQASFDNIGRGIISGYIESQDYTTLEFQMDVILDVQNEIALADLDSAEFFKEYYINKALGHTFAIFSTAGQNTSSLAGKLLAELDLTDNAAELAPEGTNVLAYIDVDDGGFISRYITPRNNSQYLNSLTFGYSPVQYAASDSLGDYEFTLPASPEGLPFNLEFSEFVADRTYFTQSNGEITEVTESFAFGPTHTASALPTVTAAPTVIFQAGGGATATAVLDGSGSIIDIDVTNGGTNFQGTPRVYIAPPAAGGTQATATATVVDGSVTEITITDPGSGYAAAPGVTITEGSGATADVVSLFATDFSGVADVVIVDNNDNRGQTFNAEVRFFPDLNSNNLLDSGEVYTAGNIPIGTPVYNSVGALEEITITNEGGGLLSAPDVVLSSGVGGQITVTAVNGAGQITDYTLNNNGEFYTADPANVDYTTTNVIDEPTFDFTLVAGEIDTIAFIDSGANFTVGDIIAFSGINLYQDVIFKGFAVEDFEITNSGAAQTDGLFYENPPQVVFSEPDFDGPGSERAEATAILGNTGRVVGLDFTTRGNGYTALPTITFVSGTGAAATSVVEPFGISEIDVTNSGNGYLAAPDVLIVDPNGNGTGATAVANLNNGQVTSITLTNAGTGYAAANVVILDPGTTFDPVSNTTIPDSAVAQVEVENGAIIGITILEGGDNYKAAPNVLLAPTANGTLVGSGFAGTATVADGSVTSIVVDAGGTGYIQGNTVSGAGTAIPASTFTTHTSFSGITRIIDWNYGTGRDRNLN